MAEALSLRPEVAALRMEAHAARLSHRSVEPAFTLGANSSYDSRVNQRPLTRFNLRSLWCCKFVVSSTESEESHDRATYVQKWLAWSVHLLTACGVLCCLLAIEATYQSQWRVALFWLVVGVAIDAIDGTFARMFRVKEVLPHFDGALLDNVIDYANYVIVPALMLHRAELLPDAVSLSVSGCVCLASAYQFCQEDAKTPDHFFMGFPSYWNVTVLYLLALRLPQEWNLGIVLGLIVLVFVPIKYIYVTRTIPLRRPTLVLTMLWSGLMLVVLWQLPDPNQALVGLSLLYVLYYAGASLWLTFANRSSPSVAD